MDETDTLKIYRMAFIIVTIAFFVLIFLYIRMENYKNENPSELVKSNCSLCEFISGTPSWLINGKFIGSGYLQNITTEQMIKNNITFIYRDGCSWCDLQKETLDMDLLNEKGLTIKC